MNKSDEKRKIQRHQLPYYLQVYNRITGKPLGYIVNLSPKGLMLVSQKRLLTHALFELEIRCPEPIAEFKIIRLKALSHWCRPDIDNTYFDTGFSITQTSVDLTILISALQEYFCFADTH